MHAFWHVDIHIVCLHVINGCLNFRWRVRKQPICWHGILDKQVHVGILCKHAGVILLA